MSRTTIEVPLKTRNIDDVLRIITAKLQNAGYNQKIVDGENIWIKGDGVLIKMHCFSYAFNERSVFLQGWMKDAITGESNLEGFVAMMPKKKFKKMMDEISSTIISRNL